jgi:hypothetical protein
MSLQKHTLQFERYTAVHKLKHGHTYEHSSSSMSSSKESSKPAVPTSKKQKAKQEEMTIWGEFKFGREVHIPLYKVLYDNRCKSYTAFTYYCMYAHAYQHDEDKQSIVHVVLCSTIPC